jgi:major membrane immunogen (membrane-anchored lipoprotein)
MKTKATAILVLVLAFLCGTCCNKAVNKITEPEDQITGTYKNGSYTGQTTIDYEGYNANCHIHVSDGQIATVDWNIYDNNRKRYFDATYEELYANYPPYIQQCRDNMVGMLGFGPKLVETQDIKKVDCITGATWCYKKFTQVIKIALKDAYADSSAATSK